MASLNPVQIIAAIYGHEPLTSGQGPMVYRVGDIASTEAGRITTIESRLENLGDRGIAWFDVWCGDRRFSSVNATSVAEVIYDNA